MSIPDELKDLRIEVEKDFSTKPGELTVTIAFKLYLGDELISETLVDTEVFEK